MLRTKNDFVEPDWRITKYQNLFGPLPFHFGTDWMKTQER